MADDELGEGCRDGGAEFAVNMGVSFVGMLEFRRFDISVEEL